jgi:hypothetical protein
MRKIIVAVLLFIVFDAQAQFDYKQNNDIDVPTLGWQTGLVGGGYTAMLPNRDDLDADLRLDPQSINFAYGGGLERIYWFQHTIGFGAQFLYWNAGAAYVGDDTITKIQLNGKSEMTYLKMPLLFHFKSYNRYYPNRRVRFTASFGPYAALMLGFKDEFVYTKETDKNYRQVSTFDGFRFTDVNGSKGTLSGRIYNPIDIGMVFAFGGEVRLGRRSVLVLQLRTDIGFSNVENTRALTLKYENTSTEMNFNVWNGYYAKFIQPNSIDVLKGFEANRPVTRNFSAGGFLAYRRYMTK